MRTFLVLLICMCSIIIPSFAEVPILSMPETLEVKGNGLHSLTFVVGQSAVSPEVEKSLSYYLEGLPAENPPVFDETSKLFFWRPEQNQVGSHTFTLVVKDRAGNQDSESVTVNVLKTATLEALPKRWEDLKEPEKYLRGRFFLPSTNLFDVDIAARPEYEIEVRVKDSMDQDCILTYIPKEGRAEINKTQKTATIMLGGQYATEYVKKVRRDLYEDLFNTLGLVFKRIESIKIKGDYLLKGFGTFDKFSLVSAAGLENIYLPTLNISFDDRFYEETLCSKEEPMLISDIPAIKIEFNTSSGLVWRRARLVIDENEYHAAWGEFSLVVVKPYKDVSSFDVDYAMYMLQFHSANKLPFGEHHFLFEVENAYGMLITKEAYARVVTLPAQIEGKPLVFPSPFNPERDKEAQIQYKLTMQTNIELVIFGADGSMVMKKRFTMGEEGAKKGVNTVTWDGKTEAGLSVSNGIYIGILIDRDENRILDRFRIAVFR